MRADLKLEIEAGAGQDECDYDDRRHDLENRHSACAHCRDLVICGKSPEDEHDGHQCRPGNRKRQYDRKHVQQEDECVFDWDSAGDIFKDLHEV